MALIFETHSDGETIRLAYAEHQGVRVLYALTRRGKCSYTVYAFVEDADGVRDEGDVTFAARDDKEAAALFDMAVNGVVTPVTLPYVIENITDITDAAG